MAGLQLSVIQQRNVADFIRECHRDQSALKQWQDAGCPMEETDTFNSQSAVWLFASGLLVGIVVGYGVLK